MTGVKNRTNNNSNNQKKNKNLSKTNMHIGNWLHKWVCMAKKSKSLQSISKTNRELIESRGHKFVSSSEMNEEFMLRTRSQHSSNHLFSQCKWQRNQRSQKSYYRVSWINVWYSFCPRAETIGIFSFQDYFFLCRKGRTEGKIKEKIEFKSAITLGFVWLVFFPLEVVALFHVLRILALLLQCQCQRSEFHFNRVNEICGFLRSWFIWAR